MNVDSQVETHCCEPIDHVQIHGDYMESWQPQPMPSVASQRTRDIVSRITSNLGGLGILGVELFVNSLGIDEALRVPQSDLRLFGKPESFVHRSKG